MHCRYNQEVLRATTDMRERVQNVSQDPPLVRKVKRQGDYWAPWGEWGECSRTCGSGITTRSRQCYSSRTDGGTSCVGPTRNFRSCNIQVKDNPEGGS
ncbi:Papilin [Acipenser ruthenus]|uniref:Papilin n=1 Tax=Acipenser ruthenus TaxID=7906 RepID=A0A662YU67_ACIRT|nr:Papilin [Acipenser ruthenus]